MRTLPDPGTYQARLNGQIVVRMEETGSLMAYVPYALVGAAVVFSGNTSVCLAARDGSLQKNNIKALKKSFPEWDHADPFGLETIEQNEDGAAQFELADCFHDDSWAPDDWDEAANGKYYQFKATWFNPLGGGLPTKEPMTPDERKKALAKFGGKFKAIANEIAGGAAPAKTTPAAAAPAGKPTAPAAPAKGKAPPTPASRKSTAAVARTSSQDEVWTPFYNREKEAGKTDDEISDAYWAVLEAIAPGKQGELTPTQWGEAADKFGV